MNICVYGASSELIDKSYILKGEELGAEIAKRGHGLVYGAGANGLMGAVARGVFSKGGYIVGVVPNFFNVDGILFEHCNELIRTETMRERKQIMEDRSDAFVMTPGGIGTFEEFFEILTSKQLARHKKAICILNVNNYFKNLIDMMKTSSEQQFMREASHELYKVFDNVSDLIDYLEQYVPLDYTPSFMKNI